MTAIIRLHVGSKRWLRPMLMLAAFLPLLNSSAQSTISQTTTNKPTPVMNTFVVMFHQGSHTLTDAERQQLNEEVIPWAKRQLAAGHKLDPRLLAPEYALRGPAITAQTTPPITALLFLEAHDLNEAAEVAASHPGLHYGFNVEVRPWAAPALRTVPVKTLATQ
jgi:hypothetical protein